MRKDVPPQTQASFDCKVQLSENEKNQIKFDDLEAIKISTNNPSIGGISMDEMLSPLETDKAIEEANALRARGILTDLGDCIDYSLEENIDIRPPPSFEIVSLINRVVQGKGEKCKNGKLSFKGKFSSEITEETTFDLPLSFPQSSIKCTVNEAKEGEEVEVSCKAQKFKNVDYFVIEPRLIKKKHKEILFVKQRKLEFSEPFGCQDYSTIKYQRAKARQNADFSFLQLSSFKPPTAGIFEFFMALLKAKDNSNFDNLPTINVHIKITTGRALRNLADEESVKEDVVTADCNLMSGNSGDSAAGLTCKGNANKADGMELDEDTKIAGLPEPAIPDLLPIKKDYSDPANLKEINSLPKVDIESIDGADCEESGNYNINGKVKGKLTDTNGVIIPFSSPDSSGLCDIEVKDETVTMKCHNKEKFESSPILFEPTTIQDSNGTSLFILNSYTNPKSLACGISVNSSDKITNSTNSTVPIVTTTPSTQGPTPEGKSNSFRYFNNNDSSGLKGGAIAGIIVAIVAALAIVTGIAIYCKGSKPKAPMENITNSSVEQIANYPNTNNF